jgi:hypothetical protein
MTLQLFAANLDEIAEQHRALYVRDGERWRLDCDHEECVRDLKTALRAERSARRFYERCLTRFVTPAGLAALNELLPGTDAHCG